MKRTYVTILGLISILFSMVTSTYSESVIQEKNIQYYNPWEKAVMTGGQINALLPFNLSKHPRGNISKYVSPLITIENKSFGDEVDYKIDLLDVNLDIEASMKQYPQPFTHFTWNNNYPTTWDMSDQETLFYTYTGGAIAASFEQFILEKFWNNAENKPYYRFMSKTAKNVIYDRYNNPFHRMKYIETVVIDGKTVVRQIPTTPEQGLYFCTDSNKDKTLNLYMLNFSQMLVWKGDLSVKSENASDVWEFQYAFKIPRTSHFEVCRIGNDLYILTNEYGIYKLDTIDAKKNAPAQPNNVFEDWGGTDRFIWDGFEQEQIVENKVKAEKISDLNYDRYIVDKDHNTAYVVADGYLYELYNLKIRSKIPELRETENFIDKEAEYMRAVLKAIYNLGSKPEKTPDELLKVTPDSEIDKALAEKEAKNGNNSITDDDDESADDKTDSGNGNDDDADSSNSGTSTSKVGDKEDGKDSTGDTADSKAAIDAGNIDKNVPDSESKSDEISDSTDVITYVSISAGILILLTIIFLALARKRRSQI